MEATIASFDQQLSALEERRVEIAGGAVELAGLSTAELEALYDEIRQFSEGLELIRPLEENVPAPRGAPPHGRGDHGDPRRKRALDTRALFPKPPLMISKRRTACGKSFERKGKRIAAALERMLAAWGLQGAAPWNVEEVPLRGEGTGARIELKGVWQRL